MDEEVLASRGEVLDSGVDHLLAEAFTASYRRLVVQMYGVTGDYGEAEDVVQEAFVRASTARRAFGSADNPEAWLRATALNLYRNRWRKLRNFTRIRDRLAPQPDQPGLDAEHLAVVEALRSLPEAQRRAVAMHYLMDLSVEDVAELERCPTGTVKSRLARGREGLAAVLGNQEVAPDA